MANLSITGAADLPAPPSAGNVLRPQTTLKLSLRLPPTFLPEDAVRVVEEKLTKNVPYGAEVALNVVSKGVGWNCPPNKPWLENSLKTGSEASP
jgi:hypothetical protein